MTKSQRIKRVDCCSFTSRTEGLTTDDLVWTGLFVTNLRQCHLGDDGQHDLLSLGWVRVLLVFVQPGLQSGRGLSGGILPSGRQVTVASVTEM